jgi:hypothetical protein
MSSTSTTQISNKRTSTANQTPVGHLSARVSRQAQIPPSKNIERAFWSTSSRCWCNHVDNTFKRQQSARCSLQIELRTLTYILCEPPRVAMSPRSGAQSRLVRNYGSRWSAATRQSKSDPTQRHGPYDRLMSSTGILTMAGCRITPVLVFWILRELHWVEFTYETDFELPSSWPVLPCYGPNLNRNILDFMRWPHIDLGAQNLNDIQRPKSFQKNSWK